MKATGFTILIGTIAALIGIFVFFRGEATKILAPDQSDATVSDVRDAMDSSAEELKEVIIENSITEETIAQLVLSEDDVERIIANVYEKVSESAQEEGRIIAPTQTVAFVGATKSLLQSTEPEVQDVREALVSEDTALAASLLKGLAEKKSSSPNTPDNETADIWETAGAIFYPIDAEQSSAAYTRATKYDPENERLASLASQIEAELLQRVSGEAPDAVRRLSDYSGPIALFGDPVTRAGVTVTPNACEPQGVQLTCRVTVEFQGAQKRIRLNGAFLLDDWSRRFIASRSELGARSDNDSTVLADLMPGAHELKLDFVPIPGGSNYGLHININDHSFIWRAVPTDELSLALRDEWGGPVGVTSFLRIDETVSLEPYALRMTGCERFGRDIRCFGQVGYAGPETRLTIRDIKLIDEEGNEYAADFSKLDTASDDDNSVFKDLTTGEYHFYFRFFAVPFSRKFKLTGSVNDGLDFSFPSFQFDVGTDDVERISYFYDFPIRLNSGGNIRFEDFKIFPKGCERTDFAGTCEFDLLYVGPKRRVHIDRSFLIDDENNYYPASKTEIVGTQRIDDDGSLFVDIAAGRYTYRQVFESLPPSRLYEHKFRLDQKVDVFVTNQTLRGEDGRMGLPTDIEFVEIDHVSTVDGVKLTTDGCVRRGRGVDCLMNVEYEGPPIRIWLDQVKLAGEAAEILASYVSLGAASDNDNSVYLDARTGQFGIVTRFQDVPTSDAYNLSMRVNRDANYSWDEAVAIE